MFTAAFYVACFSCFSCSQRSDLVNERKRNEKRLNTVTSHSNVKCAVNGRVRKMMAAINQYMRSYKTAFDIVSMVGFDETWTFKITGRFVWSSSCSFHLKSKNFNQIFFLLENPIISVYWLNRNLVNVFITSMYSWHGFRHETLFEVFSWFPSNYVSNAILMWSLRLKKMKLFL